MKCLRLFSGFFCWTLLINFRKVARKTHKLMKGNRQCWKIKQTANNESRNIGWGQPRIKPKSPDCRSSMHTATPPRPSAVPGRLFYGSYIAPNARCSAQNEKPTRKMKHEKLVWRSELSSPSLRITGPS